MSTSLIDRLAETAAAAPEHDAIVTPTRTLSYAQLLKLVSAQAEAFMDAGISGGDTVGIHFADDVEHLVLCLAAAYTGAAACTLPSDATEQAREAIVNACGITRVIPGTMAVDTISGRAHAAHAAADGARLLFSTSGTSGEPKMVVHRDAALVAQAHRHVQSRDERFACLASVEHNFARRHRLYCVAMGATNVFIDANPLTLVDQCLDLDVNVLHVSAFQAQELLAAPGIERLSAIRLKLGGSHATLALRQQLREGITNNLQAGYGTTETGAIGFTDTEDQGAGESVGNPLPGIEVRVVSANREPVPAGERGEIAIRCEGMFDEYLGRPGLTAERLDNGWFYTGDVGYLDEQGRIHLCGRADDMFVFNSMNIYPHDLEAQLCQFPGINGAAVVPRPSAVHGNIPLALVVCSDDVDFAALKDFIRARAGARSPRQFIRVAEIPRNATGKISRSASLQVYSRSEQLRNSIVNTLNAGEKKRLSESMAAAFINGEAAIPLREIDLDSLARMDLMVMLEVEYDAVFTPLEFNRLESLAEICAGVPALPAAREDSAIPGPVAVPRDAAEPYLLRFFRRVLRYCPTVTHLHRALGTLDHRLTPPDVDRLQAAFRDGRLVPAGTADKFRAAVSGWLAGLDRMMRDSGKQTPEPFEARRITPTVTHFVGPGASRNKTLLVCFPGKATRQLAVPNSVLLQHTDATQYDLLMIAEPLAEGYRLGVPSLGRNITEVARAIGELDLLQRYDRIRTVGYSAGGHAAIVAAYRLGAELGVSVAGRFHSERYPGRILQRLLATWRAVRSGRCDRIVLTYAADKTRDRNFARVVGSISNGIHMAVSLDDGQLGHHILNRIAERGELGPFLAKTVFSAADDIQAPSEGSDVVLRLRTSPRL